MESLHQHIDPKHLPVRYGGVHEDYGYDDWIKFFKNSERIRWELETLGYEDTLDGDTENENSDTTQ